MIRRIEQVRERDSRYQIGAGKVEELAHMVKEEKADTVKLIFDNPLKPVHAYNLAKATGSEAIDRFQLILEIFARRATTREAKLQIRLARLRYELAGAKEKVRLARMEEQPGFMGLGAYEVDVYHGTVKRQIRTIREKLGKIRKKRVLHRDRRSELGFSSISLAGYTNAGKSSLFNALTKEETLVDDALFTTLSTRTRLADFSQRKFLLTDTVGFIDRLPLTLIEAFHSTLEETVISDLILLVLDVSEPPVTIEKKLSCCLETIEHIGAANVPIVTALNKTDLLEDTELQKRLDSTNHGKLTPVPISALYGTNLNLLKKEILDKLRNSVLASFSIPLTNETISFISWLFDRTVVQTIKYGDTHVNVVFEAPLFFTKKVEKHVKEDFNGRFIKLPTTEA